MTDNRRSATRHDVSLDVTYQYEGETHQSELRNLSLGGGLIAREGRVPMGARVQVSFRVPNAPDTIEVGGAVRWSTPDGFGVQFDGLRAKEVWSLNKYFESLES